MKASKIKTYHISLNVKWALFTVFTFQENTYTDHPSICRHQGNTQFFRCWLTRICSSTIYMNFSTHKIQTGNHQCLCTSNIAYLSEEKDTVPLGTCITEEIIISSIHMVFAAGTYAADLSTTWWPAGRDRINTVTFVTSATYSSQCKPMTATVYINPA